MKADATNHPVSWIKREYEQETLDLSPAFQRRPIWNEEQQSLLIDSILTGFPIPEIYIRSQSTPDGRTVHEVADGQQRIRSIIDFFTDDLELIGDHVDPDLEGKFFSDLTDAEKKRFWNYKIVVRELTATDIEIRDIFHRLNLNTIELNEPELRHAQLDGEFITTVEELSDDSWWVEASIVSLRDVRRMLDVEYVSELLVGLMAGPQDKKKTLDEYYWDFDDDFPRKSTWRRHFNATRDLVEEILEDDLRRWSGKSDFYSLFLSLGSYVVDGRRFSDTEKDAIATSLDSFRSKVNKAKRKDNQEQFSKDVHSYADAVTRAATDLTRRNSRMEILTAIIERALSRAAKSSP